MIGKLRRKRLLRRSAFGTLGLLVLSLVASWVVGGLFISSHPRTVGPPPADFPAKLINLRSDSGATLAGWHVPSMNHQGVVVLLHGIRGSRLAMVDRARFLHSAGYSLVMIDLQAHGESTGDAITLGHLEKHDVRAAVKYAKSQHPREPIAVVAVSLGAASALLASPLGVDALIIESMYPNIDAAVHNRVAAQMGFLSWLPANLLLVQLKPRLGISPEDLRPIDYVPEVDCPLFVMSGTKDEHTTPAETKAIYAAAQIPSGSGSSKGPRMKICMRSLPRNTKRRC